MNPVVTVTGFWDAFITKIAGVATRITVADADKKTVDLSIVKVPR